MLTFLYLSLLILNNEDDFNLIKTIVIKESAYNVNEVNIQNRFQVNYLFDISYQGKVFLDKDLQDLTNAGWELCSAESTDWITYEDTSYESSNWKSNKIFRFYKQGKSLSLILFFSSNNKFVENKIYPLDVIVAIDKYTNEQVEEMQSSGISLTCPRA